MVTNKPPVDLVKTNQEQKSLLVPTIPSLNNSGNDSKHLADVQMLNKTFYDHLTKYMGGQDKIYDYTVVCEEYIRYMSQLNASKTSPRLVSSTSSGLNCHYCFRNIYLIIGILRNRPAEQFCGEIEIYIFIVG